MDISQIKKDIAQEMAAGKLTKHEAQIKEQRAPIKSIKDLKLKTKSGAVKEYVRTGVNGFDELFTNGIPKKSTVLIAGGPGSGKTIFCLQTLANQAKQGKKCLYMSFEESEDRLKEHLADFGVDADELIKKGTLRIQRFNPFDITRNVDALLAKIKGELLIDIDPVILPSDFKPDWIVLDSLSAIASAFTEKEDSYRIYIEQLFRFFEQMQSTSLLITETEEVPKIFSRSGVEEFLADGVVVFYNIKRGNVRERAIEVLKMRGAEHQEKIVALEIDETGVIVYPEQEVFGGISGEESQV